MAGEIYANIVGKDGAQSALYQFVNFKRAFVDAQRQNKIDIMKEGFKQQAEFRNREANRQNSLKLAGIQQGMYTPTAQDMGQTGGVTQTGEQQGIQQQASAPMQPSQSPDAAMSMANGGIGDVDGKQIFEQAKSLLSQPESLTGWHASTKVKGISNENISSIGDAIIAGKQPPDLKGFYGKAPAIKAYLADKGFDLSKASRDWISTQATAKNLNSTQQVRLGQVIDSVHNGIPALRDLSGELERTGFNPLNKIVVETKRNGISLKPKSIKDLTPDQRQIAVKYITQLNLLRDEGAQVFSGGYAPQESAFRLIDSILDPYYSDPSTQAALDQLDYNLNIRRNAIGNIRPTMVGEGKPVDMKSSSKSNSDYQKYLQAIGAQ